MKDLKEVFAAVGEALAAGRTVMITDVTETRKVIGVEIVPSGLPDCFHHHVLDVAVDYGDGEVQWWSIRATWPFDDLDGWALEEVDGNLYIAPARWF